MGQETEIECDECGEEATVPFKPTKGRPVYCKSCFEKKKKQRQRGGRKKKQSRWSRTDYHGYDPEKHAPNSSS